MPPAAGHPPMFPNMSPKMRSAGKDSPFPVVVAIFEIIHVPIIFVKAIFAGAGGFLAYSGFFVEAARAAGV